MATTATIKKNIAKLEAALKSKATPKSLKPKLETQLVKSKAELSGMNKGTKPKTSSTKSTQTALQKLKAMVNKNKKYKTYKGAGVDLEKDADRPALRTGKRVTDGTHYPYKKGNVYYEYRANRIDVKQPPKKYPKLEKGGYMADGGVSDEVYTKGYQKFRTQEIEFSINYKENGKMKEAKIKSHFKGDAVEEWRKKHPNAELIGVYERVRFSKKEKGGEINGNLEIVDFYVNEYPKDDIAVDINPKATFNGLYQILKNKGDAYKYIGVGDSVVRERVFQKLAEIKGVKYDVIYDMWMESDYAKGGYMADGGMIYKMADNMTDAEYEKKFSGLNEKQKKTYESLVRLGDSPKLALATTLLSNEVKYSEDTTRAYTMAEGGILRWNNVSIHINKNTEEDMRNAGFSFDQKGNAPIYYNGKEVGFLSNFNGVMLNDDYVDQLVPMFNNFRGAGVWNYRGWKEDAAAKKRQYGSKMEDGGYMAEGGISDKEVAESNAEMVLSQIKAVKHHAQELSNVVSKNSDIEAWVVAKIERASTDLSDITHYLEFQTKKMAMGGEIHRTQD